MIAGPAAPAVAPPDVPQRGGTGIVTALRSDVMTLVGVAIVSVFVLAAVLAPVLARHDPNVVDVSRAFAPPSSSFPLGTDELGRDIMARLLFGARVSIGAAVAATVGISAVGTAFGVIAGYFGGVADMVISRVVDILLSFPSFLLALALTGFLGPSLRNLILVVIAVSWAGYARVIRGMALVERQSQYVTAARAIGASNRRVIVRHIVPNIVSPVLVLTTLDMGAILLGLAGLSFLGLGIQPPTAEWGTMLSEGRTYIGSAPTLILFPGAAIFLMVLAFNLIGDGLRDILDPLTRGQLVAPRRWRGTRVNQ